MANYTATYVTNWFHLEHDDADLPLLRELMSLLFYGAVIHVSNSVDADGQPIYSFCAHGAITYPYEEEFEDGVPDGFGFETGYPDEGVYILGDIAELLAEGEALIVYRYAP